MVAQVLSGIQLTFTGDERSRALAAYTIALSTGAVVGQVLGGVLIAANLFGATWRPAFLLNVPIGLVLLAVSAHVFPLAGGATPRTSTSAAWRASPSACYWSSCR